MTNGKIILSAKSNMVAKKLIERKRWQNENICERHFPAATLFIGGHCSFHNKWWQQYINKHKDGETNWKPILVDVA